MTDEPDPDRRPVDEGEPLTGEPADPAGMRLRAAPPKVTRLSRKALATLGIVGCAGIGGALIFALQTPRSARPNEELYSTENRATADGVASLPRDYTAVPKLGPPLPGDLGRPILNAQGREAITSSSPEAGRPPQQQVNTERQRRMQEIESARTGHLFAASQMQSRAEPAPDALNPATIGALSMTPEAPTTQQDRQSAFLAARPDGNTASNDRVASVADPNILQAGAVISAALVTGIRSDLPGQIIAQVTENIYDSPTGRILLVPQGTRVIGEYDNNVQFGQSRVLLVWNRLIFPNGRSIVLPRARGADAQGYAGLQDGVDFHWLDLAKAASLSTLLSVGSQLAIDNDNRLLRAIRDGGQDTFNDAGQQIVRQQLSVPPTLTIRAGFPVRVIVTRDIVLEQYGEL